MKPVSIDIDGHIDLVDRATPVGQSDAEQVRIRQSRLNDVMIVMERDRPELELALRDRVSRTALAPAVEDLTLTLHQQAPEFHVAITPQKEQLAELASQDQRIALETEIAAEIFSAIRRRAARSAAQRWQPSVTATVRDDQQAQSRISQANSVWFKTLLWLLAAVILATAYLYLKGPIT